MSDVKNISQVFRQRQPPTQTLTVTITVGPLRQSMIPQIFNTVVGDGSISAAARKLGVSRQYIARYLHHTKAERMIARHERILECEKRRVKERQERLNAARMEKGFTLSARPIDPEEVR